MVDQPKFTGDATSQLVQLKARAAGFTTFKATGIGSQDVEALAKIAFNSHRQAQALWEMVREFGAALDAAGDTVPESFRAIVSAGILNARSNMELIKR